MTAKLDAMNVPYTLKGDGGTILVPADRATKLRMELASQNLPSAGVGYEIFDKSDAFGTTAFVQNINRLRALEGELARSIETIDDIDSARVHLVIPEREIFTKREPAANRIGGAEGPQRPGPRPRSPPSSISWRPPWPGCRPVASPSSTITATFWPAGDGKDGADASAAAQDQHTSDYEERLRKRIENIVASVVGPGHVRVQVAADVKYNHVQQTSETFDPDSKVVRSTQTIEFERQRRLRQGDRGFGEQRPARSGARHQFGRQERQQILEFAQRRDDELRNLQDHAAPASRMAAM